MRPDRRFSLTLAGLVAGFVVLALVITLVLPSWRMDLTEQRLFTLSEGSRGILASMEEPVSLSLYFSEGVAAEFPALRTYANRVEELLQEYVRRSGGKLELRRLDPRPFSSVEDEARARGVEPIPTGRRGDSLYFGLVAETADGEREVIPYLDMQDEAHLEYDLTRLIHSLQRDARPTVGVVADLPLDGGFDAAAGQERPPWMVLEQIREVMDLRWFDGALKALDDDLDLLMVVHPLHLSERDLLQIEQFLFAGGRLMVFLDPHAERAGTGMAPGQAIMERRSELAPLLRQWGLALSNEFVADRENAMEVSVRNLREPVRHPGLINLGPGNMATDLGLFAGLERINVSTAGALIRVDEAAAAMQWEPLLWSSNDAMLVERERLDTLERPDRLLEGFRSSNEAYTLAGHVQGTATTAFPEGVRVMTPAVEDDALEDPEPVERYIEPARSEGQVDAIVVADTDLLQDRYWVEVRDMFGQRSARPWADNGAFVLNALEYMVGSEHLMQIRSRGGYERPFERIDALEQQAQRRFRDRERQLQQELEETQERLQELAGSDMPGERALLGEEQREAIQRFQQREREIRQELREVRHQLDRDIEALETRIRLLNILVLPLVLTCGLALVWFGWRRLKRR